MLKKIIFTLVLIFCFAVSGAFADELSDVQSFFESYIKAANSYSKVLVNYYQPDAKIIRVVIKPDNTTKSVNFPMARYKSELRKSAPLARLSRYKNTYTDKKFEKLENGDYKISASRTPNGDKKSLPSYFIVTNTSEGWKIKEESMHTTVQKFLNAK